MFRAFSEHGLTIMTSIAITRIVGTNFIPIIATATREIAWMVACGILAPLGWTERFSYYGLNPEKLSPQQLAKKPVVLLHGAGANESVWLSLARRLRSANLGPLFTVRFNENNGCQKLREKINSIRDRYLLKDEEPLEVDLVGHSLGAIIAAEYAFTDEKKVPSTTVGKVISVAGRLGVTTNRLRCLFESLVTRLDKLWEKLPQSRLYAIAAERDWLVPMDAVLTGAEKGKRLIVPNTSHLSVLYATETEQQIVDWLTT